MAVLCLLGIGALLCSPLAGRGQYLRLSGGIVYGPEPNNPTLALRGNKETYTGPSLNSVPPATVWIAELWAGPAGAAECDLVLVPNSQSLIRDGFLTVTNVIVPGFKPEQTVTCQLRAYDFLKATSWAAASDPPAGVNHGSSLLFNVALGLPKTPTPISGLWERFNIHTDNVGVRVSTALLLNPSIDDSDASSGFISRVHQLGIRRFPADENRLPNAERQLAEDYRDPETGIHFPNIATLKEAIDYPEGNNFFLRKTVNWDLTADSLGDFIPSDTVPGIPADGPVWQNSFAIETRGFVFLSAGEHHWGVNSDDGFRLTLGRGRGDVFGQVLAFYNGGRGPSDSLFDFYVEKDGFYMMRLDWWQGVGGGSLEIFSVDPCTGDRILLNDRNDPRAVRVWWNGRGPAFCRGVAPAVGQTDVEVSAPIVFTLVDDGTTVDPGSISVTVNKTAQTFAIEKTDLITRVTVNAPPGGWTPATIYSGVLSFNGTQNGFIFLTTYTPPGTFFIEAEDFNNKGKANPMAGVPGMDVNKMPYYGGAYNGLSAIHDVDYHMELDETGVSDLYRIGEKPNRPMLSNLDGDFGFRGYYMATASQRVGWVFTNEWMNYTRQPVPGQYRIYGAFSSADVNAGYMGGTFSRVIGDPTTPSQQASPLGTFRGALSGTWGLNTLLPLLNTDQQPVLINLDNPPTTFRFTAGSGDVDYFALVPQISQPSVTGIKDQITSEDTPIGGLSFTVADPDTPVGSLSITARCLDPQLVPDTGFKWKGTADIRVLTITPGANAVGSAPVVVTVTDPQGGRAVTHFQLTVVAVNDPPSLGTVADQVVLEDAVSAEIPLQVSDPDSPDNALSITAKCADAGLIPDNAFVFSNVNGVRSFHFSPSANRFGTNTVTLTLTDGQASVQRTFTVRVVSVDDPPGISQIADFSMLEGTTTAPIAFTLTDIDTPAASLTITPFSSNAGAIPPGSLQFAGTTSNRTVRVTSVAGFAGPVALTFQVSDGQLTALMRFTVTILPAPKFDFGDAPDSYRTTLKNKGAVHQILPGFQLGQTVDAESDGQPDSQALGDDNSPAGAASDEDGVHFAGHLYIGLTGQVTVDGPLPTVGGGKLDAWIDWNQDGDFDDPGEWFIVHQSLSGTMSLTFQIPSNAVPGVTFSRFRLTREGINVSYGAAPDGEVEDYKVTLEKLQLDFGDAPEEGTSYPTTLARDGARHLIVPTTGIVTHVVPRLFLGRYVDPEDDGQPSATATGDDIAGPLPYNDEDGVRFLTPLYAGAQATIEVVATDSGFLDAWIDYGRDGSWKEPVDRVFANSPALVKGTNRFDFVVPQSARAGATFARFRASRAGGLSYTGLGGEGEVEDYKVTLRPAPRCDYACTGNEFWLTFPGNYAPDPANPPVPSLCILGQPETFVLVEIPGLGFSNLLAFAGSRSKQVVLPAGADLGNLNDGISRRAIHVVSTAPVSIQAINAVTNTTDGYLGLPVEVLGTEYLVQAYPNLNAGKPRLNGSQFALVATVTNTDITITPTARVGTHLPGVPFTIRLQPGEAYQLRSTNDVPGDLSGTEIVSSDPIGVFGSHRCANINGPTTFFCDYLVEQLLPVRDFGTVHPVYPLATRSGGDTVRILAAYPNTQVFINSSPAGVLQRGQVMERIIAGGALITSDQPVGVTQYANSSDYDGVDDSDPFMVNVLPSSLFTYTHQVCTGPARFRSHYLNVIAPDPAARGTTSIDGTGIAAAAWHQIGTSAFWGASIPVTQGVHTVTSKFPVGVTVYGWAPFESYGWTGCIAFGDIIPPVIVPPPDIALVAGSGFGAAGGTALGCRAVLPSLVQGARAFDNCSTEGLVIQQTPPAGTLLGPGTYVITFTTRDGRGNLGSATSTVTVSEPDPLPIPVLQCPSNIVVECTSSLGARVTYQAYAQQLCRAPIPLECDPPSGTLFGVGTTTVTCTLPDPVNPQSCTFTVTVTCKEFPHTLDATVDKGLLVLRWTANLGGRLQSAPTVLGPWTDVTGAKSPFQVEIGKGIRFFRLVPGS
jgi:hypothetical protein